VFTVTRTSELTALFRVLLEAKFHEDPVDRDIAASPFVAQMAIRVRDELMCLEIEREGERARQRWAEWALITPERREWKVASMIAARMWQHSWAQWTAEMRESIVHQLLSPFDVSREAATAFVAELEARWNPR
jgi:hypothetical protein